MIAIIAWKDLIIIVLGLEHVLEREIIRKKRVLESKGNKQSIDHS